jgi:tachykinin-like receptor
MNPLRPRMGKRTTLCIAAGIWLIGCLIASPMLMFYTTYTEILSNNDARVYCYGEWPDGPTNHSNQEHMFVILFLIVRLFLYLWLSFPLFFRYNILFMFLTYFVPIGAMTFTYARVGVELWGSQSIGECTQRQLENIKSKRRVSTWWLIDITAEQLPQEATISFLMWAVTLKRLAVGNPEYTAQIKPPSLKWIKLKSCSQNRPRAILFI